MLVYTRSATIQGLNVTTIEIEADSVRGKPSFLVIGLPEKALEEARERITSALLSCGVRPKCKKTLINLAPADVRKTGSNLELAIAVALWQLTTEKQWSDRQDIFFGELSLDGRLRAIRGALPLVNFAKKHGFKRVFLPSVHQGEVKTISGIKIYLIDHLQQVLDFLAGKIDLRPLVPQAYHADAQTYKVDFADIVGQQTAKRCLEIAAAGGHNLLLKGVPGAGKSLLASALPSILPPLSQQEALELTTIYSVCGLAAAAGLITVRPCRAPHHTVSAIGLVGGGAQLLPGEISLAHHGVLFLDELGEFHRDALEVLRQPLETGQIVISRASGRVVYPADVTLIAATNPCPCGYLGSKKKPCHCSPAEIARYRRKLSGPILDRLEMQIFVPEVDLTELAQTKLPTGETSATIRARVIRARERQLARLAPLGLLTNQQLSSAHVRQYLPMTAAATKLLQQAAQKWQLSARSYFKLIKVARTIADLAPTTIDIIDVAQIAESLQYRQNN